MFEARPLPPYMPALEKRKMPPYTGVAAFVNLFEDPKDAPPPHEHNPMERADVRRERRRKERMAQHAAMLKEISATCACFFFLVAISLFCVLILWVLQTIPRKMSTPSQTLTRRCLSHA